MNIQHDADMLEAEQKGRREALAEAAVKLGPMAEGCRQSKNGERAKGIEVAIAELQRMR